YRYCAEPEDARARKSQALRHDSHDVRSAQSDASADSRHIAPVALPSFKAVTLSSIGGQSGRRYLTVSASHHVPVGEANACRATKNENDCTFPICTSFIGRDVSGCNPRNNVLRRMRPRRRKNKARSAYPQSSPRDRRQRMGLANDTAEENVSRPSVGAAKTTSRGSREGKVWLLVMTKRSRLCNP
ncbi:hypothetical protein P153DRAFT_415619, partial [Dothidotthia symphoricarpi CBS 119687]